MDAEERRTARFAAGGVDLRDGRWRYPPRLSLTSPTHLTPPVERLNPTYAIARRTSAASSSIVLADSRCLRFGIEGWTIGTNAVPLAVATGMRSTPRHDFAFDHGARSSGKSAAMNAVGARPRLNTRRGRIKSNAKRRNAWHLSVNAASRLPGMPPLTGSSPSRRHGHAFVQKSLSRGMPARSTSFSNPRHVAPSISLR